ncbi:MAG TPA: DoxX family protein [Verrucomicrobiae bacterium]|nr:DoxX family protein [Verrucomicrobiae bacterium]
MNSLPVSGIARWISWTCRLLAVSILLQTLLLKLAGAEKFVSLFTQLGIEPWGRVASALVELVAAILILLPRYSWTGGLLALLLATGAIISHLAVLGLGVNNDGGRLFALAVTVWICGATVAWLHHFRIPCSQHSCHCSSSAGDLPKAKS